MIDHSSVQHCLRDLAAVFNFPSKEVPFSFSNRVDRIISSGEYAVSVTFKSIRKVIADGEVERNPVDMSTLQCMTGTGIAFLEATITVAEQNAVDPLKREKLSLFLKEYKKLFDDIALSDDIDSFIIPPMFEKFDK